MIERVARALCESFGVNADDCYPDGSVRWTVYVQAACAAIAAMRQATEAMIDDGSDVLIGQKIRRGTVGFVFRAMIDTALKDEGA
jgi:hypothetical protein